MPSIANLNLNYEGSRTRTRSTRTTTDPADRKFTNPDSYIRQYKPPSTPKPSTTSTGRTTVPGSATPQPAPVAKPAQPDAGAVQPETYDLSTLEQILASIEAQYGVSREELLAGEGEASDLYRFVVANLRAAQTQAQEQVTESALGRGILRSGIAQEQQARVTNQFSQQQAQAQAQRDQQLADIALAIQALEADLQREKTGAAVDFANQNLNSERARAKALELV